MTTMTITARSNELNPSTREKLSLVTEHLNRFFRRVLKVEWTIARESSSFEVHLHLHAVSGHFQARGRSHNMVEAIGHAAEAVERQRRRNKEMKLRRKRQSKSILLYAAE